MALPLLEMRALNKCHTARSRIFRACLECLHLYPGDAVGITGPSGCGKSSLLEMLALLTRPDSADCFSLHCQGKSYDLAGLWQSDAHGTLSVVRRKYMGFVHQAGGLYPFLSVQDNIALPLRLTEQYEGTGRERVAELLSFLGLEHLAHSLPENLSYGERQRTAVARALAHRPALILADEPTSALDPDAARTVMRLMLEGARKFGAALVVVSHDHALLNAVGIPAFAMQAAPTVAAHEIRYSLALPSATVGSSSNTDESTADGQEADTQSHAAHAPSCSHRPDLRLAALLAWRDFWHERSLSFCAVLAFAAALTPLMVLGGLRAGVVSILSQRLLDNPAALAVNPYSSQRYSEQDIAELAALPSVAFVAPLTRTLASTVQVQREGRPPVLADVLPTAAGDPLLERYASVPSEHGAVITQELARSMPKAVPGQELTLVVTRRHDGKAQEAVCRVRLHAILPDAADWKSRIYLPLPLLLDMERYRDGYEVSRLGWSGLPEPAGQDRSYAGFRMYVNSLDDVIPMRDALKQRGIDAYTFAREVETIQGLKHALTLTTLLVGGVTLAGMAFSLVSLSVANVSRKARMYAQGSLMGLKRGELLALPLLQMGFVALLAASASLVFYGCAAMLLDMVAGPWLLAGESACSLPGEQVAMLYIGALVLSCLCGVSACRHLLRLQPAEVLRRDA